MKKFILPALFLGAIAFTSCKKDYTCDCTYTWSDGTTQTYTYEYPKSKKKDAEASCESWNGTSGYECTLK